MRNLGEPGARFRAAAQNHPEALLLEEPQAFQAVREKTYSFLSFWVFALHHCIVQVPVMPL